MKPKKKDLRIEEKLKKMGLVLPEPTLVPKGVSLPFSSVRVVGDRAFISGHGPTNPDGSLWDRLGKVGGDLSLEEGYEAAKSTALAILGDLKRALGDLDRVAAWLKVLGMVNTSPGFNQTPAVINGFSDLINELYGPQRGTHARSAIGVAELPFDIPVEIEAEVMIEI